MKGRLKYLHLVAPFLISFVATSEAKPSKFFAFINGGYSPDSNYWVHEQDILAFRNGLFKNSPHRILSANGPDSVFAETDGNGNLSRKPDNYVSLKPTKAGGDIEAASLENVTKLYRDIAAQRPSEALIVHGDHGMKHGLMLWGNQILAPETLFPLQESVPKNTVLRSVFLQCFAGAMLVDQKRTLPSTPGELKTFSEKHYPANRCGLALGRHDEMGQYNNHETIWTNSPWTKHFQTAKPTSLAKMKEFLNGDSDLAPTTMTTSDYFTDDLASYFCTQFKSPTGSGQISDAGGQCFKNGISDAVDNLHAPLVKTLCELNTKNQPLAAQVEEKFNLWASQRALFNYWAGEYLKISDERWSEFLDLLKEQQYYAYKAVNPELNQVERDKLLAEWNRINNQIPPQFESEYQQAVDQLAQMKDSNFVQFFDKNCTADWLKSDDIGKLMPDFYAKAIAANASNRNCRENVTVAQRLREESQMRFKAANISVGKKKTALVEELLTDPRFKEVKDRYENIKRCENGAIN